VKHKPILLLVWMLISTILVGCIPQKGDFVGINQLTSDQMDQIDSIVDRYRGNYDYINIALIVDEEIVLTKSYGQNRLNKKEVYASVSKPVTAMVFFQLLEEGMFGSIMDDIGQYDPDYAGVLPEPYADAEITFYHLLTHQSGVTHLSELWKDEKLDLAFRPGSSVAYSSNAFGIVGDVLEEVTGHSYPKLVKERIGKPVDARSFDAPDWFASPSGQVRSTIEDMALFGIGVMQGTFVSMETLHTLVAQKYAQHEYGEICLGWYCTNAGTEDLVLYHAGSNGKPRAFLSIKPEHGYGLALTGMNKSENNVQDFGELAVELMDVLRGWN
jgi:CubicO group peptidase (beta-lactamase class C family)